MSKIVKTLVHKGNIRTGNCEGIVDVTEDGRYIIRAGANLAEPTEHLTRTLLLKDEDLTATEKTLLKIREQFIMLKLNGILTKKIAKGSNLVTWKTSAPIELDSQVLARSLICGSYNGKKMPVHGFAKNQQKNIVMELAQKAMRPL